METYGPHRHKTCLQGFRQSEFQTSLFSYSEISLDGTFQNLNNKGADQTARMCRLVSAFVVRKPPKTGFLLSRPIFEHAQHFIQATKCY